MARYVFPQIILSQSLLNRVTWLHVESIPENALEGRSEFNCNTVHSHAISCYSGWSNNLYIASFNKLLYAPIFQDWEIEISKIENSIIIKFINYSFVM